MIRHPDERFPTEVQPVEADVRRFQPSDDANGVGVVVEAAAVGHRLAQRIFAGMAEWRVAEVVGEAKHFGQVFVEAERPGDGAADLRDLEAVGQPNPVMIAVGGHEHLGLVTKPAEGHRMDDSVAVALEDVARPAAIAFRMKPAARRARLRGKAGEHRHCGASIGSEAS